MVVEIAECEKTGADHVKMGIGKVGDSSRIGQMADEGGALHRRMSHERGKLLDLLDSNQIVWMLGGGEV